MSKLPPPEAQRIAQNRHGYGSILLSREGDEAVVYVLVGELYVPVIREYYDGQFYHSVEPLGIEDEIVRFFAKRKPLFQVKSFYQGIIPKRTRYDIESTLTIDAKGNLLRIGGSCELWAPYVDYPVKIYSTKAEESSQPSGKKGQRGRNRRVAPPLETAKTKQPKLKKETT